MPDPDLTKLKTEEITAGPAFLLLGGVAVSHTQGGVSVNITPATRNRTVDYYGESVLQVVHIGDDVRVTAPLAQWTKEVLQTVYDPGKDNSTSENPHYGIGRSAGFIYRTKELQVIPVATTMAAKKIVLWKVCPVGQIELNHGYDADRVFNCEFVACIDQSKADGLLLGAIYLGEALGSGDEGSGA